MAERTIIDILRKGNQELFHSSMIAWLLDPQDEHGFGPGFLEAFANVVLHKGHPRMRSALHSASGATITTETSAHKSRYDIVIRLGNVRVVIENKTKSLGDEPQFEKYKSEGTVLIALGLCDISFSEAVKADSSVAVVTYADVLEILDSLPEPPPSDFKVLVDHYRKFLRRELAILSEIDRWYSTGAPADGTALVSAASTLTTNDHRFLNLYLLERLRRSLFLDPVWKECSWRMDKNMQSGVWLALFELGIRSGGFKYADPLSLLWKELDVNVWFHVELWDGVLAKNADGIAGEVQLRCQTANQDQVVKELRRLRPLLDKERYAAKLKKGANSFFLVSRPLLKKHLTASLFSQQMNEFAASFGAFTGQEGE